jgi:hypothetical protein
MADEYQAARDTAVSHVESLIRRGQELQQRPDAPANGARADAIRAWQQQCADAIVHLSGGSKAHWLSRAFSDALLVRSIDGAAVVEAPAEDIVRRVVGVLARARTSLLQVDGDPSITAREADAASVDAGPYRPGLEAAGGQRFTFVHRSELQPILARAFADSGNAFERGDFGDALVLACGVLETIITDALEHAIEAAQPAGDGPRVVDTAFAARIAAAERAGLIRGGCARLPRIGLAYRDLLDEDGDLRADAIVTARDARVAGQVLRVVIRDLDPGR